MKQPVLVLIKPDGIKKQLLGDILSKFIQTKLALIAIRPVEVSRLLAEKHYQHLKEKPFFEQIVFYLIGQFHAQKVLLAMIFYGESAVKKCRHVAGATNPEEAEPTSIRGVYGRITTEGLYENVVHVSSNSKESEREIKLWFDPEDIIINIFPTRMKTVRAQKMRIWA